MIDLEKSLFDFSESTIDFEIGGKVIKTGVLKGWKAQPFYLELMLERANKKEDKYRVQYPFGFEYYPEDGLMFLDYRVDTFNQKFKAEFCASCVDNLITDKKFNEILTISKQTNE